MDSALLALLCHRAFADANARPPPNSADFDRCDAVK
jgi:hypothetical protein